MRGLTSKGAAALSVAAIILAAMLAGCTALSGAARIENYAEPAGNAFPGLLPSSADRVSQRYVFQIHGINTPDENWGEPLLQDIVAKGYNRQQTEGPIDGHWHPATLSVPKIVRDQGLKCGSSDACRFDRFGIYRKDVFRNDSTGDQVTVFTYFWRGDLWLLTGPYVSPDLTANQVGFPSTRKSTLNEQIKAGVIDNGFSDAAGYLSDIGALEREGLETALCAMFADAIGVAADQVPPGSGCLARLSNLAGATSNTVEFNFLSHSLGSRMLYDVLSGDDVQAQMARSDDAIEARRFIASRTRTFFMAANQMPLLAVTGAQISPAPIRAAAPAPLGKTFFELRSVKAARFSQAVPTPELTVVAFQDPDDLLGFKASDALLGSSLSGVRILDVLHRNTDQWLFLFSWPPSAHDQELVEPNSLAMILCGAGADASGLLSANTCLIRRLK